MELQRGICSLCLDNSKVLKPSDSEQFSKLLLDIFDESFITSAELQKIKTLLKLCSICCYQLQSIKDAKLKITDAESRDDEEEDQCRFCKTDSGLIELKGDWKFIIDRTRDFLTPADFPLLVCPHCIFYLDAKYKIKTNLTYKFPYLGTKNIHLVKTPPKTVDTPKRKSLSKSPSSSKKRKIFDNCFNYLQPVSSAKYRVAKPLKRNVKLYKHIAFVDLSKSKHVAEKTPKSRPAIKIKLKPLSKKHLKVKKSAEKRLSKSEPQTAKPTRPLRRNSSFTDTADVPAEQEDQKIDDTPKAAISADVAPKRRVSDYMGVETADSEKSEELSPAEISDKLEEEADQEVAEVLNSADGPGEMAPEETRVEENGVDLTTPSPVNMDDGGSNEAVSPVSEVCDTNGDDVDDGDKAPEGESPQAKTPEVEAERVVTPSPIMTPLVVSGEFDDVENTESFTLDDDLNSSERKKKRVTFSDEIS